MPILTNRDGHRLDVDHRHIEAFAQRGYYATGEPAPISVDDPPGDDAPSQEPTTPKPRAGRNKTQE